MMPILFYSEYLAITQKSIQHNSRIHLVFSFQLTRKIISMFDLKILSLKNNIASYHDFLITLEDK